MHRLGSITVDDRNIAPSREDPPLIEIAHDERPTLVLAAALLAMTLVAGLTYTFSVAVMPNLAGADDRTFVETMQRFNSNPAFVLSFAAALVLTVLAAVLQRRRAPASPPAGPSWRWCSTGSSSL